MIKLERITMLIMAVTLFILAATTLRNVMELQAVNKRLEQLEKHGQ